MPPQRRLASKQSAKPSLLVVREGMLAIDAILPGGRRQILDFLLPGDVVSAEARISSTKVSIRAVTDTALLFTNQSDTSPSDRAPEEWALLFTAVQAQLARANVHRLMIGHLDVESRVASFLLTLAFRTSAECEVELSLPGSREDIADYLVMNPDTLSRIMMRFETLGLISRVNRRSIRIESMEGLRNLSPIAALVSAAFQR